MLHSLNENYDFLTRQLTELIDEVKNKLPREDVKNVINFIDHNEFELAHDTICFQLYEYNVPISREFYEKISSCGKLMKIPASIWEPLKELIII